MPDYDYRNCQSLFGYAARVHERSGGACQLCGAGTADVDFDLWRQLTVEHLIGESQGGYLRQITASLTSRFPGMTATGRADLAARIDAANTVTACSFCNATTSRGQAPISMASLIKQCPDGPPGQVYERITAGLAGILAAKRTDVAWKLASVRKAFDSDVAPRLAQARLAPELTPAAVAVAVAAADAEAVAERITADVAVTPESFVIPPGYAHLSHALIDAVYSIRSRYTAVQRVVAGYAAATGTECQPLAERSHPGFREHGLDRLLEHAGTLTGEALADALFAGSRSRTAGRLKADVCIDAARRLQAAGITCIPDLIEHSDDPSARHAWTGVHGLAWITWQYLCSLAGIDHLKPDVMLTRFVSETLGRHASPAETDALLACALNALLHDHPGLTKRALDHTIWWFQRDQ
jgi:hypothetical protein